jgi:hypothetical protein
MSPRRGHFSLYAQDSDLHGYGSAAEEVTVEPREKQKAKKAECTKADQ